VHPTRRSFVTIGDAARSIGVRARTIKHWAEAGHVQITRVAGRDVLAREEFTRVLATVGDVFPVREPPWEMEDVRAGTDNHALPSTWTAGGPFPAWLASSLDAQIRLTRILALGGATLSALVLGWAFLR
jgi:hypothetical protein